jgi:hypothetical protein
MGGTRISARLIARRGLIGCDETTSGIQAESRAKVAVQAETEILQFCDGDDRPVEVLGGQNGGRRHCWQSIRSDVTRQCR